MSDIRLPALPANYSRTRESMHRLAEAVVKAAREHVTGVFSLVRTEDGFGTPIFGEDDQVRVEGTDLVVRERSEERRAPITSLRAAAELVGPRLLGDVDLDDEPLDLDRAAAQALAACYELGEAVLAQLVAGAREGEDPTGPTLWPEHFDIAVELGREADGQRANYGLSPGDENHDEPYFYVGPWTARPQGELWNARGFPGAELSYTEVAMAEDSFDLAIEFALERKRALEGGEEI